MLRGLKVQFESVVRWLGRVRDSRLVKEDFVSNDLFGHLVNKSKYIFF